MMSDMDQFFSNFWSNVLNEFIFGVIIFGLILAAIWKRLTSWLWANYIYYRILSVHNSPTCTRQRGLCFVDRFMEIYESKGPLRSTAEFVVPYAIWHNMVIDEKVLEHHGLVETFDNKGTKQVRIISNHLTRYLYKKCKKWSVREKKRTDGFLKNENLRKVD